jgi:hypothetical protein
MSDSMGMGGADDILSSLQALLGLSGGINTPISVLPIIRKHNPDLDLHREFCSLMTDALDSVEVLGVISKDESNRRAESVVAKTKEDIDHYVIRFSYYMDKVSLIFTSPLWDSMPPRLHDNIFNSILHKEQAVREMFSEFYDANGTIKDLDIDIAFNSHPQKGAPRDFFHVRIFLDSFEEAKDILDAFMKDLDTFELNHFTQPQDLSRGRDVLSGIGDDHDHDHDSDNPLGDASFEKCQECPGALNGCEMYEALLAKLDAEDPAKANELREIVAELQDELEKDPASFLMRKLGGLGGLMGGNGPLDLN